MSPIRDREIVTPDDEDDIAEARAEAYEREICRGDYLADELRDRQMEERYEDAKPHTLTEHVAKLGSVIESELSRLRAENIRFRAFIESIVDANGPYPSLDKHQIVRDAYAVLGPVTAPVEWKSVTNPPAKSITHWGDPEEELLREHEANPESFREPLPFRCRFFRETSTGIEWVWNGVKMTTDGEDSVFKSPEEILECLDVIETDRCGNALTPEPNA